MARQTRINLKLIAAIICILAGVVILWRTFGDTPAPLAQSPTSEASIPTEEPTRRANAELATPMPTLTPVPETGGYPIPATNVPLSSPTVALEPPSPTLIVPTAVGVVPTAIAIEQPTASIAATSARPTQPGATPTATPQPTLTSQIVPTAVPATVVVSATVVPTSISAATATPSATATPTSTTAPIPPTSTPTRTTVGAATPTSTTIAGQVTITYIVESTAPVKIILLYGDSMGKTVDTEVETPWTLTFMSKNDIDLFIDAYTNEDVGAVLTCQILVDGKSVLPAPVRDDSYKGVLCERLVE
jgi:hypothetical protein